MARENKIYPIPCQISSQNGAQVVQIIKVASTSILVNTLEKPLLVNSVFGLQFTLPLTGDHADTNRKKDAKIDTTGIVFKTYDEFKGTHGLVQPGNHVSEIMIKNPSPEVRQFLAKFIAYQNHFAKL